MNTLTIIDFRNSRKSNKKLINRHAALSKAEKTRSLIRARLEQKLQAATHVEVTLDVDPSTTVKVEDEDWERREAIERRLSAIKTPRRPSDHAAATIRTTELILPEGARQSSQLLRHISAWVTGQYEQAWRESAGDSPTAFDVMDNRVEILREAFSLASDLFIARKTQLAFSTLNLALDATRTLMSDPHPPLCITMLEVSTGMNMPHIPIELRRLIKRHITEIATVMLGRAHPLTLILQCGTDSTGSTDVAEPLLNCLADTLGATFGKLSRQAIMARFAQSHVLANAGQLERAAVLMSDIHHKSSIVYGTEAYSTSIAKLKLSKMRLDLSDGADFRAQMDAMDALMTTETAAGLEIAATPLGAWRPAQFSCSLWEMDLARKLLQMEKYSLAYSIYVKSHGLREQTQDLADKLEGVLRESFIGG